MARFESPWQIVGLFVMAGLLSMVIMSALRIEAQKRYGQESIDGPEGEAEPEPQPNEEDFDQPESTEGNRFSIFRALAKLKAKIRGMIQSHEESAEVPRRKRSLEANEANDESKFVKMDLASSVLTEVMNGHKIRNIGEKVKGFDENDPITKSFLAIFCDPKLDKAKQELSQELNRLYRLELDEAKEALQGAFQHDLEVIRARYNDTCNCSASSNDESSNEPSPWRTHEAPPIRSHSEVSLDSSGDLSTANWTSQGHPPPPFVCRSYGELLITVAVTTVVNVTFFGSILLCRKLVVKWDARIANDQGYRQFDDDLQASCDDFVGKPGIIIQRARPLPL